MRFSLRRSIGAVYYFLLFPTVLWFKSVGPFIVWKRTATAYALCVALVSHFGCSSSPPALEMPALEPGAAGDAAIEEYDANGDGQIGAGELDKSPGLKAALRTLDKDGDRQVSAAEIAGRLTRYESLGIALVSANCEVSLNGQPLSGADVTLVPEKFMGAAVKPAKGTTDEQGNCLLQVEGEEFSGTHCGIFRVEISKKDASGKELVPSKYNANTILGVDTGPGGTMGEGSLILKLSGS
jgi:hypothetical protein